MKNTKSEIKDYAQIKYSKSFTVLNATPLNIIIF